MAQRGLDPALTRGVRAFSRADACACSAQARGFTLLEVLVVMAIVAALIAALTLSFAGSASRRLENAARRAQALIELSCDRASLSGSDMGIRVVRDPSGDRLDFGFIDVGGWHAIVGQDSSDPLRPRALGEAVTLRLQRDGRELRLDGEAGGPQLACLGSGELTPFALELRAAGSNEAWRLRGDAMQRFTLERIDGR